jgi:hypothetical protein
MGYFKSMFGQLSIIFSICLFEAAGRLFNSLYRPAGWLGSEFVGIILPAMLTAGLPASVGFF